VTWEPPTTRWVFPDPVEAVDDIVAVGADLEPGTILAAYRQGLFPMPLDQVAEMAWWSPVWRGIIPLNGLRVTRSMRPTTVASNSSAEAGSRLSPVACCEPIDRRLRPTCTGRNDHQAAARVEMAPCGGTRAQIGVARLRGRGKIDAENRLPHLRRLQQYRVGQGQEIRPDLLDAIHSGLTQAPFVIPGIVLACLLLASPLLAFVRPPSAVRHQLSVRSEEVVEGELRTVEASLPPGS